MQAIFTRYLPATRHMPERIQATTEGFNRSTPLPEGKKGDDLGVHLEAMRAMAKFFKMQGVVTIGETPVGLVFVFLGKWDEYYVPERIPQGAKTGSDADGNPIYSQVYLDDEGNITEILGPLTPEDDLI